MTLSDTPSRAISTVCACRSWCGANRRRTPARTASERNVARAGAGDHGRPCVGLSMTHSSAPTGSATRARSHGSSCSRAHGSIPTWRRLPPLPRRARTLPRERSRSLSARVSASLMRRPARQRMTMSARVLRPCVVSPACRMTATISSMAGGSAAYRRPCSAAVDRGGSRAWSPESGDGQQRRERLDRS